MRRAPGERDQDLAASVTAMLKAKSRLIVTLHDGNRRWRPVHVPLGLTTDHRIELHDETEHISYAIEAKQITEYAECTDTLLSITAKGRGGDKRVLETYEVRHLFLRWSRGRIVDDKLELSADELQWSRRAQLVDYVKREVMASCSDSLYGKDLAVLLEAPLDMAIDIGFLIMYSSFARAGGVILPIKGTVLEPFSAGEPTSAFAIAGEWCKTIEQFKEACPVDVVDVRVFLATVSAMKVIPSGRKPVQGPGLEGNDGYNLNSIISIHERMMDLTHAILLQVLQHIHSRRRALAQATRTRSQTQGKCRTFRARPLQDWREEEAGPGEGKAQNGPC